MSGDVARKECLQSDIDLLSSTVLRLEARVAKFAKPDSVQSKSEAPMAALSVPESLRRQVQMIEKRIQDMTSTLGSELGKLT